jgi:hypothetical protein
MNNIQFSLKSCFLIVGLIVTFHTAYAQDKNPIILNPGFDIEGNKGFRDHWDNKELGGMLQVTTGPIHSGVRSAKLPPDGSRIAYQVIKVEKNKTYKLSFYYTMKPTPEGTMTVAILAGHLTNPAAISASTINSVVLHDKTKANNYVKETITFNSGNNAEVAILISNVGAESRIDSITIDNI